jgi:hypothetical protein
MGKANFQVNIPPEEAMNLVKDNENADLVHEEIQDVGDGKQIGTLVFEKYYFRTKNRAALVVIMDNFQGNTDVRVVATGSSQGMIFNFDWGASDNFVASVESILQAYIV